MAGAASGLREDQEGHRRLWSLHHADAVSGTADRVGAGQNCRAAAGRVRSSCFRHGHGCRGGVPENTDCRANFSNRPPQADADPRFRVDLQLRRRLAELAGGDAGLDGRAKAIPVDRALEQIAVAPIPAPGRWGPSVRSVTCPDRPDAIDARSMTDAERAGSR